MARGGSNPPFRTNTPAESSDSVSALRRIISGDSSHTEFSTVSHLSSFHAVQFRGISGLRLGTLAQVNVLTGANGIGKTSVAEAIWLFNGRFGAPLLWNQHVQRSTHAATDPLARLGNGAVELAGEERGIVHRWKATFGPLPTAGTEQTERTRQDNGSPVTEGAVGDPSQLRHSIRGQLRVWLDGQAFDGQHLPMPVSAGSAVLVPILQGSSDRPSAIIHLPLSAMDVEKETINGFSALVEQGQKKNLKQALRVILPLLDDVEVITSPDGEPFILATTLGGDRLPLQALGGGMTRLFRLFVSFHKVKGGIVIVDEIENGLHYEVLAELWRRCRTMTETYDVQLFATTHSRECLLAAVDAFDDQPNALAIHSLYQKKGVSGVHALRPLAPQRAEEDRLEEEILFLPAEAVVPLFQSGTWIGRTANRAPQRHRPRVASPHRRRGRRPQRHGVLQTPGNLTQRELRCAASACDRHRQRADLRALERRDRPALVARG